MKEASETPEFIDLPESLTSDVASAEKQTLPKKKIKV